MATGGYGGVERRRTARANQSPLAVLRELPALVVLERIPAPVLAVGSDGVILFANGAFAAMLGHTPEAVLSLTFDQIFHPPIDESDAASVVRAYAGLLVELAHANGSIVRATMSKSAMWRGDDPLALATFQDRTEQLWTDGR